MEIAQKVVKTREMILLWNRKMSREKERERERLVPSTTHSLCSGLGLQNVNNTKGEGEGTEESGSTDSSLPSGCVRVRSSTL